MFKKKSDDAIVSLDKKCSDFFGHITMFTISHRSPYL
jgi:hypothetical protein